MSQPIRIASTLASGTEIACALGLAEHIVAISHECDYPTEISNRPRVTKTRINADAASKTIDDEVRALASSNGSIYEVDAALLASLKPDVIIVQKQCEVCAVSPDDIVRAAKSQPALATARVVALNPGSLDGILDDVRAVAGATGSTAAGEQLIGSMRSRMDSVRTRAAAARSRPRVMCIEWIEPMMLGGNWMPTLIEYAGGSCHLVRAGEKSIEVDHDAMLEFDPEVVVVMPCGFDLKRTLREAHDLKSYPGWYDMTAFKARRIYAVDGNAYFNRSGPRIVDSLEILAGLVHPELFDDFAKKYASAWSRIS